MSVKEKLKELGILLPEPPKPVGLYVPLKVSGQFVFVSGMLPLKDGRLMATGRVPSEVSIEEAQGCVRQIVLNLLALLDESIGLERVGQCLRVNGYVASEDGFFEQPMVLNAGSEVLNQLFEGGHTRTAIGVSCLPMNSPVEMDFILALK